MSLSADQVVWLNRVAGSALPVPDKEPEHDKTGGTPPTPPKGPLTR